MINRTFTPGTVYTLDVINDKIIFLAIACIETSTNVYIAMQRLDWPTVQSAHIFCDINKIDYQRWVKRLTKL